MHEDYNIFLVGTTFPSLHDQLLFSPPVKYPEHEPSNVDKYLLFVCLMKSAPLQQHCQPLLILRVVEDATQAYSEFLHHLMQLLFHFQIALSKISSGSMGAQSK